MPTVEELTRSFHAQITEAARREFTNAGLVADWIAYNRDEQTAATIRSWENKAATLLAWCDAKGLHLLSFTRPEAQAFVKWLPTGDYEGRKKEGSLKAGSVLAHAQAASSLFNYLVNVRHVALGNPFREVVKSFKKKNKSELRPDLRAVDEREVAILLESAESLDDFLMELLLFKTGIRREEAITIRMDGIDWKARTFQVQPHPKRTYCTVLFDEETEYFLRLKCQRNHEEHPGNPWLWPSPQEKGGHISESFVRDAVKRLVDASPLAATVTGPASAITPHTNRRGFTSVMKRRGCPSHVVAILRGDSLLGRGELTPDATQGIYTKMGTVEGKPELRYWFDKCMPNVGAREIWERLMPTRKTTATVAGLIRARRAGAV